MRKPDPAEIEEIIIGECPSCNNHSAFLCLGVQEGCREVPDFVLYDCYSCGSTISGRRIRR
ncbi:MAG: hypothetical protein KKE50_01745 [Nanoarchaeota archaeon]|nr:hypothetical protein [Nanoarchaeota archaeon]